MKKAAIVCVIFLSVLVTTSANGGSVFPWCGGDSQISCAGLCDIGFSPDASLVCRSCGDEGQASCYGICDFGLVLDLVSNTCTPCGDNGQISCFGICYSGLAPDASLYCRPCGAEGQASCYGTCNSGMYYRLASNTCEACGADGIPKCSGENALPCQEWRTVNSNYPDLCIACGGFGQFACDYSLSSPGLCRDKNSEISAAGRCEPCGDAGQPQCAENGTTDTATTEGDPLLVPKQTLEPDESVWGFVDAHEHQFANDAYGGAMFWGKPFSAGGINKALASCDYTWDFPTKYGNPLYYLDYPAFTWLGASLDGRGFPVHGMNMATIIPFRPVPTQLLFGLTVNMATADSHYDSDAAEFLFSGWPELAEILQFDLIPHMHHVTGADDFYLHSDEDHGWPHYLDGGHQQMYYKWLERSYQAGLRLLVNMPVNNEELCKLSIQRKGYSCDDMDVTYKQIDSIKALERFVDLEDDGIINQTGWYRIAYSPQQAREIIEDGAMAVILSVEVDSLFGCKPGTEDTFCTNEYIDEQIDILYRAGVRHLFPVHLFDNAFSGAAYYSDIFSIANSFNTGDIFQPADCVNDEERYSYKFADWSSIVNLLYSPVASLYGADFDILTNSFSVLDPNRGADCNSKGLSDRGEYLLTALMKKGMLIDIDHFSHLAMLDVLDILEEKNYPPVSSHTVVVPDIEQPLSVEELAEGARTELGVSRSLAKKIIQMGGHIAINPSRPSHIEGWEGGTTKQFVYGLHKQFPGAQSIPPYYEKRILGYNDIIALIDEVYRENNEGLTSDDAGWLDPDYPHISFAGDFGAFVNQPEPRFTNDAYYLEPKCAPDALLDNLPEECTKAIINEEGKPPHTSINCPAALAHLFLPQDCLLEAQTDGTISLNIYPPLEYPFEGFEPVDKDDPDGAKTGEFARQTTGTRTFDFNTDGLAHYGLVPDLLADARDNYGAELKPLFNSAEAFIRMWERVYRADGEDCNDADGDGICDGLDTCPGHDDNLDTDGDNIPDACDHCVNDPLNDSDGDTICGDVDNCPGTPNSDQGDYDNDGWGDVCDPDDDNDGVVDVDDECPLEDASSVDADSDGCVDSFAGLDGFIEQLVGAGLVDAKLYNPLISKIVNAEKSVAKGNICAAINQIKAYNHQVKAKQGKSISTELAYQLIQYGNNLITLLRVDLPDGKGCKK